MLPNLMPFIPVHSPALLPTLHLSTSPVYATGPRYPLISLPALPSCIHPVYLPSLCLSESLSFSCSTYFMLPVSGCRLSSYIDTVFRLELAFTYETVGQDPLKNNTSNKIGLCLLLDRILLLLDFGINLRFG